MQFDGLRGCSRLDRAEFEPERNDALLRAVVQVTFEPAAGLVGRRDDADPRCRELGLGLGVEDRGSHQIREIHDARLGFGGIGSGRVEPTTRAPQVRPSTETGPPTPDDRPSRRSRSAVGPAAAR